MNKRQQSLLVTVNVSILACMLIVIAACTPAEVAAETERVKKAVQALQWIAGKASPTEAERRFGRALQAQLTSAVNNGGGLPYDLRRELTRALLAVEKLNDTVLNLPFVED